jgi:hypothetical protein
MNRAFLTGSDEKTEWLLEWFLKNYRKHNDTPIIFADFGVTKETRVWANAMFDGYFAIPKRKQHGWFMKPKAMLMVEAKEACWIDTDIHVLGDLSGVWNYVENNKLAMVEDKPWSKRTGQKWHNSGVVAFKHKPDILKNWVSACKEKPSRGDQETLHHLIGWPPLVKLMHVTDLPNIYNWLRVQIENDNEDNPNKLAMHWTGEKGKNQIRRIMYNE